MCRLFSRDGFLILDERSTRGAPGGARGARWALDRKSSFKFYIPSHTYFLSIAIPSAVAFKFWLWLLKKANVVPSSLHGFL
jgi:hypothetical protein